MTEDERPDDRVYTDHWAQPYDSAATAPGGAPPRDFVVWAQWADGSRVEATVPCGASALRWMNRMDRMGAVRRGYSPA